MSTADELARKRGARERTITNLAEIVSQPTTSYFEGRVAAKIRELMDVPGITMTRDAYGNLIAKYIGDVAAQPVAFVAHMDHPGIEVIAPDRVRIHGGLSQEYFSDDVAVRIIHEGAEVPGVISNLVQDPDNHNDVQLDLACDIDATGSFGVWDLPDFTEVGNYQDEDTTLYMRAADDLAGCAVVVETLLQLAEARLPVYAYGVFTRAEETGLCGATLMGRGGRTIPKRAIVVSVETSKALLGAEIGQGATIRVGDASSVFGSRAEYLLKQAVKQLKQEDEHFRSQRQLMSGGVCEASSFMLFGYETIGIALPLGNYHNMGPGSLLAAEYISSNDVLSAVDMSVRLAQIADDSTLADSRAREVMCEWADANRDRLIETARQI